MLGGMSGGEFEADIMYEQGIGVMNEEHSSVCMSAEVMKFADEICGFARDA